MKKTRHIADQAAKKSDNITRITAPESKDIAGDLVDQSIQLARTWSGCLSTAVLARPVTFDGAIGVSVAETAPLLAWDPLRSDDLVAVLEELGVSEVVVTSPTISPPIDIEVRVVEPTSPPSPTPRPETTGTTRPRWDPS